MPRRHREIEEWEQYADEVLAQHEAWLHPAGIDDALGEAFLRGEMTPEEVDQCRRDYLGVEEV